MMITATELTAQAYSRIRKMILEQRLKPGEKIVQEKLAAELGISRTPLRSALQQLEGENLVVAIPRRGMFVRQFSRTEILEIYECRAALEATAGRLLAQRASTEDIAALEACFAPFAEGGIDLEAYRKADLRFHELILERCGNHFLQELFRKGNMLFCIDQIGLVRPINETLPEHRVIIDAIKAGKELEVDTLLRDHLLKAKKELTDG